MSTDFTTADLFLRSGGVITFTEWKSLGESEREALQEAFNRLESERRYRLVTLMNGDIDELNNTMTDILGAEEWRRIRALKQ